MWLWHVPAMYDLAIEHAWAHVLEHASFFTAGIVFWWYLIEPVPPRHRLRGPWSLAYLSAAKLLMGALGVVLAFSPEVSYDAYEQAPRTWGLSPLEDLNVGGVIMMVEQSIVLVIAFTSCGCSSARSGTSSGASGSRPGADAGAQPWG
jgi:cytochrome c oxidase assembly factor CtaG